MSEINKTLLRKVRNKILRVPEAYSQTLWGNPAKTPCGTRACIAGHALIEGGFCSPLELNRRKRVDPKTGSFKRAWDSRLHIDVEEEARALLGLSMSQADVLFDCRAAGWPAPFESRFRRAKTKQEKARVAADYINWIIRHGRVY